MIIAFYIILAVYIITVPILGILYGDRDISISFWSILSLTLPVVNTIVLFYILIKNSGVRKDLRTFLNELKGGR